MPTKKRTKRAGTKSSSKKAAKATKSKRAATTAKTTVAKKKPAKKPAKKTAETPAKAAKTPARKAAKNAPKKAAKNAPKKAAKNAPEKAAKKASEKSATMAAKPKAGAKATPARRADPPKTAAPAAAQSSANGQSRVRAAPLASGARTDITSRTTRNLRRPDRSGDVPPAPPPVAQSDAAEPDYGEHIFDLRHPHGHRQTDDVGERMAESTLRAITGDHDGDFEDSDRLSVAETGGPFVETSAEEEFGYGDGGLPEDTEPSALPATNGDDPATPEDALDEDEE